MKNLLYKLFSGQKFKCAVLCNKSKPN